MKRYYYTKFSSALVLFLLFALPFRAEPNDYYRVTSVNDGDTVTIRTSGFLGIPFKKERVRLIGIDAPELKQEMWGRKAKKYLKRILSENDWIVRIELDTEHRDKYGRLLAYLWDNKGRMVNERMIENGYAILYTFPPNVKYVDRLTAAQKKAQTKKTGIWAKGGLEKTPWDWRMEHQK